MKESKWVIDFRLYICVCGKAFWSRKHFVEHIKDSKRWNKYHYAPSFTQNRCGFVIHLVHKRGKNINEAFIDNLKG